MQSPSHDTSRGYSYQRHYQPSLSSTHSPDHVDHAAQPVSYRPVVQNAQVQRSTYGYPQDHHHPALVASNPVCLQSLPIAQQSGSSVNPQYSPEQYTSDGQFDSQYHPCRIVDAHDFKIPWHPTRTGMYTANPPLICSEHTVLQMESVSDHSAVDIATNTISDAGSFFLPVPPLFEQWTSSWTPDIPAVSHMPPVNAERAFIRSIDGRAEMQHPEYPITGIHDEGLPVIWHSASGSMYRTTFPWCPSKSTSTLLETEHFLAPDSTISNEGQIDINLADEDTDRNQPQEGVLMNARLDHGCQYTHIHTTSNPSAPSITQGISSKPTAVQCLGESPSRDRSQKLRKSGNVPEKASSQSSQPPSGIGGALGEGLYPCDICGKRYAQRQGVRRHYRAIHDHPNSCSYCDFKWSRPYIYGAHLKAKHRDVVPDAAQDEATWTGYRVANTASPPQQQPVLTLTPEHGRRGGTEIRWCPLKTRPSSVVKAVPARLPALQRVDHDPQPLGSAEPTIRRNRKREDAPESELRTELLSTEVRAQLAKDLDMPVRKVQTWFQDEGSPRQGGYGGNVVLGSHR